MSAIRHTDSVGFGQKVDGLDLANWTQL